MAERWSIRRHAGATYVSCEALERPGIAHAFGTRTHDAGAAASCAGQQLAELAALSGCGSAPGPSLFQVHGARIVRARDVGVEGVRADAVWERADDLDDRFLAIRTADCVPILLASCEGAVIAAIHAGWRGTAQRIAAQAVAALAAAGSPPAGLVAALGPSIGPCCYPVSQEVAGRVSAASRAGSAGIVLSDSARTRIDLREANRHQLLEAGIPEGSVHSAPWCTSCAAELFFSYRRDGDAAGRQFNLIGPRAVRP